MEQDTQEIIQNMDAKFKKACQQLRLLNSWIERLQTRYDRAASANKRSHRYSLRIKLCVIEGVRNMFYEYALRMADQLDDMRQQMGLLEQTSGDENTTDDDNSDQSTYEEEDRENDDDDEGDQSNEPQVAAEGTSADNVGT